MYTIGWVNFRLFFKFYAFACCLKFPWVQYGEMPNFFDFGSKTRVGISSKSLIFCERKSEKVIHWLERANCSHLSFVKSNESECSRLLFCKEWQEPFALGRRAMGAIRFWHKKGKSSGKLFFKEQWEQIAYSQSLKCATLSKRPKSKRVNSQPWFLIYLLCFLLESFLNSCAWS